MLSGLQIAQMVTPSLPAKVDDGVVPSYGPDACGYTLRMQHSEPTYWHLGARDTVMGQTLEYIRMPLDCAGLLYIKSTYGRQGFVLINTAPIDPGYEGYLTVGLFNTRKHHQKVFTHGGICMLVVHRLEIPASTPYAGRWSGI